MVPATETKYLNVIIVDDEIDACRNLRKTLLEFLDDPWINVAGTAQSTKVAEALITEHQPDVVFLDIEMPNENAFDFLERIGPVFFDVVFVTAYDEYAIKAFRLNAIDYILKPIGIDEVSRAVGRARERAIYKRISGPTGLYNEIGRSLKTHEKLNKLKLKDSTGFYVVDFKDILYAEASGSYSVIWFLADDKSEKNILTSTSLNEYEALLPDDIFCRVHRSYLVNCMHVKKVLNEDNSFVIMKNKAQLPVSRRRISDLNLFFKK